MALTRRGLWQVHLRWAVAPLVCAGVLVGEALGFALPATPILLIALASLAYNGVLAWIFGRFADRLDADPRLERRLVILEVVADYAAMLLLVHLTGGASSPLALFLLFHVILGAIQFTPGTAYLFAALAAGGLWSLLALHVTGWWPSQGLAFRGQALHLLDRPVHAAVYLGFFTAVLFLTATLVSRIVLQLRRRLDDLGHVTAELVDLNGRLNSLTVSRATVPLILDTTAAGIGCHVLTVAVGYHQRALPVTWHAGQGSRGHTDAFTHIGLLERVATQLAHDADVMVLGDGEFGAVALLTWLEAHGWHYALRVACDTYVYYEDEWRRIDSFDVRPGEVLWIQDVELTQASPYGPVNFS